MPSIAVALITVHQTNCGKKTAGIDISHRVWQYLWRWAKRRHPQKSKKWIKDRYFKSIKGNQWRFVCEKERRGKISLISVYPNRISPRN
ncbi:group II intron maturase-specific domain-containing protein [Cylindrospermopsis raciborskii]|uniref:group II intron maturase-specific domain-containing protein n=1 Tax=Cylindrospermopsis raciborskii TaxID=77022 RepID=UPI001BAC7B7D